MRRNIVSLIIGIAIFSIGSYLFFVFSGITVNREQPNELMVGGILFGSFLALFSGYATAMFSKTNHMMIAMLLGAGIILIGGVLYLTGEAARWWLLTSIFVIAPSALIGGYLRKLQVGL